MFARLMFCHENECMMSVSEDWLKVLNDTTHRIKPFRIAHHDNVQTKIYGFAD
nr:hypothetical protein [Roseibium aggregatum]